MADVLSAHNVVSLHAAYRTYEYAFADNLPVRPEGSAAVVLAAAGASAVVVLRCLTLFVATLGRGELKGDVDFPEALGESFHKHLEMRFRDLPAARRHIVVPVGADV
ncbi:hypothetical protein OG786_29620 [Streptomyces sp. NBC_00101]|uniref:hypothetical protein n=1 Tax=Streptomyces sp. NBC_00101 TaxID=2975651 RepID=UPI003252D3B4